MNAALKTKIAALKKEPKIFSVESAKAPVPKFQKKLSNVMEMLLKLLMRLIREKITPIWLYS
jgi:hypothetical protein